MYVNPVLDVPGKDQGDPAILRYKGKYYLYHTGAFEVPVYCSTDLVNWQYKGIALRSSERQDHWAAVDLWAPEVIYAQGRFYMYLTGTQALDDGSGDDGVRRIGVAVADSPLGPFKLAENPLANEWSIDAHPFQDSDGTWYLYYNVRNELTTGPGGVIGCGNLVDKMVDFETLEGRPSFVCKPEFHWEGSLEGDWYWNEGSFTIKRLGKYYQMYSGGCYYQPTYHIGYAVSSVARGDRGLADRSYIKWPNGVSKPVLQSNEEVWGPGHHVVTKGPNGIQDYVVYHGHVGDDQTRTTYIDPLYWFGDAIYVDGPTAHQRTGPYLPKKSQEQWEINGTEFLDVAPSTDYLWEVWLPTHSGLTAYLGYSDAENFIALEQGKTSMSVKVCHRAQVEQTELPISQTAEAYTLLRVIRNGLVVSLYLDDVMVWQGTHALAASLVGIKSKRPVVVEGVVYTRFFADSFTSEPEARTSSGLVTHTLKQEITDWQLIQGHCKVVASGVSGIQENNTLRRTFPADDFLFSCDLQGSVHIHLELAEKHSITTRLDTNSQELAIYWELDGKRGETSQMLSKSHGYKWENLRIEGVEGSLKIYSKDTLVHTLNTKYGLEAVQIGLGPSALMNNISVVELN